MGRVTLSSISISGSGELGRAFCLLPRDKKVNLSVPNDALEQALHFMNQGS
jgi:hypothetical protein